MLTSCHLLEKATGIKVQRVDFSDPQGDKGPCDKKAATIKAHVRRYINEGHGVLTAAHLKEAMLSYGFSGLQRTTGDMCRGKIRGGKHP
jgi:hypothetical protein